MEQKEFEEYSSTAKWGAVATILGGAFSYEALKNFNEYNTYQSERNPGQTFGIPNGYISLGLSGLLTFAGLFVTTISFIYMRKLRKAFNSKGLEKRLDDK